MSQAPQNADQPRLRNGTFAADYGGDGNNVVRVGGVPHPQKETDRENCQSGSHVFAGAQFPCRIPENGQGSTPCGRVAEAKFVLGIVLTGAASSLPVAHEV